MGSGRGLKRTQRVLQSKRNQGKVLAALCNHKTRWTTARAAEEVTLCWRDCFDRR